MHERARNEWGGRAIERSLVIADDPWFRRALRRAVVEVFACGAETSSRLRWPASKPFDLVVVDVDLFTDKSFRLIETIIAARPRPFTIVLATSAPPLAAFRAGSMGVEALLQKPFTLPQFKEEVAAAFARAPKPELVGRSWVGRVELRAAQVEVRRGMLDQALELSHGNLSHAARILSVSRQALQRIARATRRSAEDDDSYETVA